MATRSGMVAGVHTLTILDCGRPVEAAYRDDGDALRVPEAAVPKITGWKLEPHGLCRDDLCIPVRDESLATADGVSLAALAAALGRPLAVDRNEAAAYLGAPAAAQPAVVTGAMAPDFSLPDWRGGTGGLAEHRGRKVLLAAWASW